MRAKHAEWHGTNVTAAVASVSMDLSFTAPARVQALVLPVGSIKTSLFQQYYTRLDSANEVRLADLSTNSQIERSMFNPKSYPSGVILYEFSRTETSSLYAPLFDIEPWREKLLILGIAHYGHCENLENDLREMQNKHGAHCSCQILVFGVPSAADFTPSSNIWPVLSSNFTSLETALCDVSVNFLNSLNAFVIAKQLGSFKSPSLKLLDLADSGTKLSVEKNLKRHAPKNSSVSLTRSGSISMGLTERSKARQKGRALKFLGSFYLLTGRLPSALENLAEAATIFKQAHDHLWFASALESIGVCLVLQAFYELPVTIPTVALTSVMGEAESFIQRYAKLTQNHQLSEFIPDLMNTVLRFYSRCNPDSEEAVPQTIYQDSVLRTATLLSAWRIGGGCNGASLSTIVRNTPIDVVNITPQSPALQDIEEWCSLLLTPQVDDLPTHGLFQVFKGLMTVYALLRLWRKWAFVAQLFVTKLGDKGENDIVHDFPGDLLESLFDQLTTMYEVPRMKITCIRAFISLATRIGNYKFVAHASCLLLATGPSLLSKNEQQSLYQIIRDDGEVDHDYWDPYLLRALQLPIAVQPKNKRISNPQQGGPGGAIIYNPYSTDVEGTGPVLVQNDPTPVKVMLQNPFAFEIHVLEISIVDENEKVVGKPVHDLFLPPQTVQSHTIELVAPEVGTLKIIGCLIQISGCVPKLFKLHHIPNPNRLIRVKPGALNDQHIKMDPVTAEVVPARPNLVLRKTSLQKGWAMLLEGERASFTVEISNISNTASDVLQFGFNDSTIDPLKQAINAGDATKPEIYELEYFLLKRQAVQMCSATKALAAHSTEVFEFELNGKRGVTNASIIVESISKYANTRIKIPISVTVYPSVDLDNVDIVQISQNGSISADVLVILDLRNSWRQALDVSLWISDDESGQKTSHRIDCFRSQRFLVPMKWPYIAQEDLQKPIPSLSQKQYVVDLKTTTEMLQTFWLREKLLEKLRGEWRTVSDENIEPRTGIVEFRVIQLTRKLVNVLKTNSLSITMSSDTKPQVDQVCIINTTVHNNAAREFSGMLRLIPDNPNKVLVIGNLQRPVTIPPNGSTVVSTQVMPLDLGPVEWSAILDVIGGTQAFQRDPLVLCA